MMVLGNQSVIMRPRHHMPIILDPITGSFDGVLSRVDYKRPYKADVNSQSGG